MFLSRTVRYRRIDLSVLSLGTYERRLGSRQPSVLRAALGVTSYFVVLRAVDRRITTEKIS